MPDPFVTIGGDAAGLSAASKLKREDPDREVIVFEKGSWVSYAHCGTPYYVKGEVENLEDLLSLSPTDIREREIDLRRHHEVVAVDADAETVTVEGPDGMFTQPYGDLLVATGARAVTGPFDMNTLPGAFTLHGLDSAAAIRAYLTPPAAFDPADVSAYADRDALERYGGLVAPKRAAIVGGGYVGVEMAEALVARGLDVTLFQRSGSLLPPFGKAVGEQVADHLRKQGVTVRTDTAVSAIEGDDRVETVVHGDGRLDVGLAIVGVGIRPNVDVLDGALELGESGAVATDEYGRTSVPGVYAAGDCAEAPHAVTGDPEWVPLGLTANRAGRAIGETIAGDPTPVGEIAGTAVVKAFDLGCGRTGIVDPDAAREAGFDPVSKTITAGSRSGYYPGSADTTVTLIADRESGRLLGGATVGKDRAAKKVDTVATAVDAGMTVFEVERLDLGYAPPFSPVWDPVLVAAKVLAGRLPQ
jgi:NADPH-dependent 2,4-dienoyl-CoA reductase/sulfur reductase-like enzyme